MLDPAFVTLACLYRLLGGRELEGCTVEDLAADARQRGIDVDVKIGVARLVRRKLAIRKGGLVRLTGKGMKECERLYWW